MKKVIGLFLAVVLMPSMSAQAWIGGPWSHNTYSATGDDGVYEAVATMTDGVGMYRWAVNNNNVGSYTDAAGTAYAGSNVLFGGLGGTYSPHVWFYRGMTYYGQCFGIVNSMINKVVVTGNASAAGETGSSITGPTSPTSASGSVVTLYGPGIGDGSLGAGDENPKGWCNSQWDGRITGKVPYVRFHGVGRVNFFGETFDQYDQLDYTSDSGTQVTRGGGEIDYFPDTGHGRSFKVFGSQVSYVVTR